MIARLIAAVRSAAATPTSALYITAGAMLTAAGLTMLGRTHRAQIAALGAAGAQLQEADEAIAIRRAFLRRLEDQEAAKVDQVLEDRDS